MPDHAIPGRVTLGTRPFGIAAISASRHLHHGPGQHVGYRLQAYEEAGADVLFAPGLRDLETMKAVISSVDAPVNVLVSAGAPTVAEVAAAGAARISVGGSRAIVAYAALPEAATEMKEAGTYDAITHGFQSATAVRQAFGA